jgi:citronellyl-CoA dehydrogenase
MERIMRLTIAYCRQRHTFGRPLIDNQCHPVQNLRTAHRSRSFAPLNYHCVRLIVAGEDVTKEVSMAKLKAGRLAREVADTCLQFHGGMGYVEEYPMARYFRDARLLSIGGGADEIMLGIIAKYENILPGR